MIAYTHWARITSCTSMEEKSWEDLLGICTVPVYQVSSNISLHIASFQKDLSVDSGQSCNEDMQL